jgi:pyruvate dehydrogenase E2 component (dihydrolipoamide acetyltransferase)
LSTLPAHNIMRMPALSPTMTQGNIASWKVKEGDVIKPGSVVAEIETDKAAVDLEVQEDGIVAKLVQPAGTKDIPVGSPIVRGGLRGVRQSDARSGARSPGGFGG